MSTTTHQPMTNHHASGAVAAIYDTLHLWHDRYQQRRELAHWSARDIHDAGLSVMDVVAEADKPFWRA